MKVVKPVKSFYEHQYHEVTRDGEYKYMTFTRSISSEGDALMEEVRQFRKITVC